VWSAVMTLMHEVQANNPIAELVLPSPVPLQPRVSGGGGEGVNNTLLQMFDDLYDPNNEEDLNPVQEPELIRDAAALSKILRDELTSYQTMKGQMMMDGPNGPRDISAVYTNPLHWWARNESILPHMSILAKQYLCIPATSAPSERVFSAAGLTIAKSRASLHPDNASDLIFLHNSWPYAEKYDLKRKAAEEQKKTSTPITIVV
jgi:zinc finger BED domain-containing protein 1 (E3 SUMO-protein ligase ZBED1)